MASTICRLFYRFVQYSTDIVPRELGIGSDTAFLDDVPGYAWGLIDVMAKSGLRYLIHGPGGFRSNAADDMPIIYYIAGPSGCDVLVFRTVVYYQEFDRNIKPSYIPSVDGPRGSIIGLSWATGSTSGAWCKNLDPSSMPQRSSGRSFRLRVPSSANTKRRLGS